MSLELVELLPKIGSVLVYVTAITGSIYYYKYNRNSFLKFFLILLWYAAINDIVGLLLHRSSILRNNSIIYNIYHLINFSSLLILFKSFVIVEKKYKNWITIFLFIFIVIFSLNHFLGFQNYFEEVIMTPFIVGSLFIIISIVFYFLEILNTNKILYISKNSLFWISIGLLLYHAGKIPIRIVRIHWESININTLDRIFAVEYFLSIIMNICFIIGFLCSQKVRK